MIGDRKVVNATKLIHCVVINHFIQLVQIKLLLLSRKLENNRYFAVET